VFFNSDKLLNPDEETQPRRLSATLGRSGRAAGTDAQLWMNVPPSHIPPAGMAREAIRWVPKFFFLHFRILVVHHVLHLRAYPADPL
jgi:hypothetical protein